MRLIQRGSVISCERTRSAVGAARMWQRWVWAVCNYVGLMVCLRNPLWWCLMIILILGSFAKGVYILHNPPFMLKIPIQHFWATCAASKKKQWQTLFHILYWEKRMLKNGTERQSIYTSSPLMRLRVWRRADGGSVSVTWFLSGCTLTVLSFFVTLTKPSTVWCESVFASVSKHIHTFADFVCTLIV